MSDVKIKKAKITDDLFLYVEYSEEVMGSADPNENTSNYKIPIHDDLRTSFEKLHKHLAVLCEEVTVTGTQRSIDEWDHKALYLKSESQPDDLGDDKDGSKPLTKFTARSFSIGGKAENEGVTISGMKRLRTGKVVNLNTPFTKWTDKDYVFMSDLAADIESCIYEVEEYLFNNKRAPEKQLSLFEDDSLVEEAL